MTFIENGIELVLRKGEYVKNGATYLGLVCVENEEPYVDVTVNTPFSAKNSIVLDHDFISLCSKELIKDVLDKIAGEKISNINIGYYTLPKYWLKMEALKDIEHI